MISTESNLLSVPITEGVPLTEGLAYTEGLPFEIPAFALGVACFAVLTTMVLALVRAMAGPTVFDRVLALNMFGTKTVLFICVISFLGGRTDFLDLAVLYSLMNFIGMVALLRFTTTGSFGDTEASE